MSRTPRTAAHILALAAFVLAPASLGAKPKPTTMPSAHEVEPGAAPKIPTTPIVTPPADVPVVPKAIEHAKPLSKSEIVDIGKRFDITLPSAEIRAPITLSVRRPYLSWATRLEITGKVVIDTGLPSDGVATLRDAYIMPTRLPGRPPVLLDKDIRFWDAWHETFRDGPVEIADNFVVVQFMAEASRSYVVSCTMDSERTMVLGALVEVDGAYAAWHNDLTLRSSRASFVIEEAPGQRIVRITLAPKRGQYWWSIGRCDITPVG